MNKACLMKLGRDLRCESADLWCEVLRRKYARDSDNSHLLIAKGTTNSSPWKNIAKLGTDFNKFEFWSIGDGVHVHAWKDKWINGDIRISEMGLNIPQDQINYNVADLVTVDGNWNTSSFGDWLPSDVFNKIIAMHPPSANDGPELRL